MCVVCVCLFPHQRLLLLLVRRGVVQHAAFVSRAEGPRRRRRVVVVVVGVRVTRSLRHTGAARVDYAPPLPLSSSCFPAASLRLRERRPAKNRPITARTTYYGRRPAATLPLTGPSLLPWLPEPPSSPPTVYVSGARV